MFVCDFVEFIFHGVQPYIFIFHIIKAVLIFISNKF